jgi:hypothetical protein
VTGFSASPTGPGTSSKHCRSHCGTPPTGRSSACSTNQSQGWLSRFRKATRYLAPTVSICPSDGLTIWYTVTETPEGQVVIVVQYVKADT